MKTELQNTLNALKKGNIILYPTDTVWGIGCDATNANAVQKIYKLKQRDDSKSMICLVNNLAMLEAHVTDVPKLAYTLLGQTKKPTTIIYNKPKGVAKNIIAANNTLAIRLVKHQFCEQLIQQFGKPIVSTSANISGESTPKSFKEISNNILMGVDYIVNLHRENTGTKASAIIKINADQSMDIIRE